MAEISTVVVKMSISAFEQPKAGSNNKVIDQALLGMNVVKGGSDDWSGYFPIDTDTKGLSRKLRSAMKRTGVTMQGFGVTDTPFMIKKGTKLAYVQVTSKPAIVVPEAEEAEEAEEDATEDTIGEDVENVTHTTKVAKVAKVAK